MLPLTTANPAAWAPFSSPYRYSYAAVLAAVAVGLLAPGLAGWLLGPVLLAGMLLLGVAHGACDQFVVPATHPALARDKIRYWARFLVGYLGLAAAVVALWWWQPGPTLAMFFALTAWHWGSADAPVLATRQRGQWVAHSLLRGGLLFALPLAYWPAETQGIVSGLLGLVGTPLADASALGTVAGPLGVAVGAGHLLLWARYVQQGQADRVRTDLGEVLLLVVLLLVLPPVLSATVYFVFWHSLQHVLRMNRLMELPAAGRPRGVGAEVRLFLRRAAPLLLISVAGLAVLYGLALARAASGTVLVSLALLAASVVTLPHALLVTLGMDAPRWRQKALSGQE